MLALLVAGLAAWPPPATRAEEPAPTEYQVKAAWLLNFARFIDWPPETLGSNNAPMVIGVLGADPFGADLENTLRDVAVYNRKFLVQRNPSEAEARRCHILFLSSSERKRHREILEKLQGAPVLTVGETEEFIAQGGMINFVRKDNTVRFAVNLDAAGPAGLKISAKMLKVALSVKGRYTKEKE